MHMHRSELKQTVELDHERRMGILNHYIEKVEASIPPVRELIA